ncbi:MAG: hypothetical protein IKH56_00725 [Oscillospiraceae bacterium]|nr:hypothetical protein [Oscillospiraceae bacterium]
MSLQLRLRTETGALYKQAPTGIQRVSVVPTWNEQRLTFFIIRQKSESPIFHHVLNFD